MKVLGMQYLFMLLVGSVLAFVGVAHAADGASGGTSRNHANVARAVATQDIEYLRRAYARATDKIGKNTPAAIAAGRAVYQRIFTPDVILKVKGEGVPAEDSVGPDTWVQVVADALKEWDVTQHLIGTQIVELEKLEVDAGGQIVSGHASMTSYLQAWHAVGEEKVWLFIGTYHDKVRYSRESGWQIYETTIERVSGEARPLGAGSD